MTGGLLMLTDRSHAIRLVPEIICSNLEYEPVDCNRIYTFLSNVTIEWIASLKKTTTRMRLPWKLNIYSIFR
jgi:hypothetical protein